MQQQNRQEHMDSSRIEYDESKVDWIAVRDRIRRCIFDMKIPFWEVAEFLGLDFNSENYIVEYSKLPKMKTAIAVATYLGVPASWLLTGKMPEKKNAARQIVSDTVDSTVVQGNSARTMIINNQAALMPDHKRELMRVFDTLSIRGQIKLIHYAYDVEDEEKQQNRVKLS